VCEIPGGTSPRHGRVAELLRLILQAREAAMDDADRAPPSRPRSDIKSDESAMA
jgi:hypothetical protein